MANPEKKDAPVHTDAPKTPEPRVMSKRDVVRMVANDSPFAIRENGDRSYSIVYGWKEFPWKLASPDAVIDFRHRLERLAAVHETCQKKRPLLNECKFYLDKASLTQGNHYSDLFIDSGTILPKTTALTHERLKDIFSTNRPLPIMRDVMAYMNDVLAPENAPDGRTVLAKND